MADRTTFKVPTTGTDVDIMTDERTVPALSGGFPAKVQYFAEINGTPDSPNVSVIDANNAKRVALQDGGDVAQGATTDATWNGSAAATAMSIWRYIGVKLEAIRVLLAGTINVATGLVQGLTDAQLRASAVPVSGAFYQGTQPVSNASDARRTVTATVALALDTVGYTAGDALGAIFTLAALSRLGSQSVVVAHVRITTNNSAFVPTLRVQFFNAANPASDVADNAAFAYLTADENGVWQGFIDLPPMSTTLVGSPTFAQAFDAFEHSVVTDASGHLYGQITTLTTISSKVNPQILTVTVTVREK